jgi:uncharacterized protein (UPF0332 family)
MTDEEARREVVRYWLDQAREALASARSEAAARRFNFGVNRAYYACFYAVSAILLSEGRKFVKHSGVRAALHRHLVKTGRVGLELGEFYDLLFRRRGQADYAELVAFDEPQVAEMIQKAAEFVGAMERILAKAT